MSTIEFSKILAISTNGIVPSATPTIYFDGTNAITSTCYSVPVLAKKVDTLGLQWTTPVGSTLVGTLALQGSNDAGQLEQNMTPDVTLTNWATISFWDESSASWTQSKAIASGASSGIETVQVFSARWYRWLFTFASGSGDLVLKVQEKADGGR